MIDTKIVREAPALLVVAVGLGLAYNSLSPLGIPLGGEAGSLPTVELNGRDAAIAGGSRRPAEVSDPALHNETIAAAIVAGGPEAGLSEAPHKLPGVLSWAEVRVLLARSEAVLVDGRDSISYEAGHIPGAVSLPLKMLDEKIGEFTQRYPKSTPLVIYCASIQCPISHAEAITLAEQVGYTDVREMPGGYAEWMVAERKGTTTAGSKP